MMYQKPKGTRDIYGKDLCRIEGVCQCARDFFSQHGYIEIRTPTFEFAELFIRSIGTHTDIVEKENYTFTIGDKVYMLRPEGTAPVLRAIIENKVILPQRFLYIEPMFRKERPQKGRYREFLQIGIEHIGDIAPIYDAMMIEQGRRFLMKVGAGEFMIEVNSIGCHVCRAEYKKILNAYLVPKIGSLCKDCTRRIERNFLRIFDCKNEQCQKIYDQAPKVTDNLCVECADHYQKVHQYLNMLHVPFTENKKLVRGLDYYTRTVFEFKTDVLQAQDTILAGGRYDMLMQELGGRDTPALGWAMGVDRLLLTMPPGAPHIEQKKVVFIAAMGESYVPDTLPICKTLHNIGYVCVYGNPDDTIKKQMKKAHRLNVNYVVIYGEQEASTKVCAIKDMESGKQQNVPIHALSQYMKTL